MALATSSLEWRLGNAAGLEKSEAVPDISISMIQFSCGILEISLEDTGKMVKQSDGGNIF